MLGQRDQSIRAMERALALVRENRFVLRSAARLFVHVDEPDRAHQLVVHADSTRGDPWLLAAEIAVATVAGRRPLFVRQGRQVLGGQDYPALHTTELASAIATVEMTAGDVKTARRPFKDSLVDPTDNSLAQAGWAATKMAGVEVAPELMRKPRSFEARALRESREGQWRSAIRQCEDWLLDEPFSSRPAVLGSYLASVAEQDYRLSGQLAERGLRANLGDPLLLNNLAVALANEGRVDEAIKIFNEIGSIADETRPTFLATEGLLNFRSGRVDSGRRLYLDAIAQARRKGDRRTEALATLHLAREELLAGTEKAVESLAAAAKACEGIEWLEVGQMLRLITDLRR